MQDKFLERPHRDNELRLRLALRGAGIGIWDWDLTKNTFDYSARARAICGFPPGTEVTRQMVRDIVHPEDHPRTSAMAARAIDPAIREDVPYEYRIIRANDGEVRWVRAFGEAVFSKRGKQTRAIRYVGTIEDVTDRKLQEVQLAGVATRLALALEAAEMAVWEVDLATEQVITSPQLNKIFGFDQDASPTIHDFRSRYVAGERERVRQAAEEAIKKGERRFDSEFQIRPDGKCSRWLLLRAEIEFSAEDVPIRVIGVVVDIDDRKRAEQRRDVFARELNHRVKNSLAVVQALAGRSFTSDRSLAENVAVFRERLADLAAANDVLVQSEWTEFTLRSLVDLVAGPYRSANAGDFEICGEDVTLPPSLTTPLALILHEMCTNAAKYGALSVPDGRVRIAWTETEGQMSLRWVETGGPPVVGGTPGFGSKLIRQAFAGEFEKVDLRYPSTGAELVIVFGQ